MKMKLKEAFHSLPEVKEWSQKEAGRHLITGLTGSAKTLFLAELFLENAGPKLIVCDDLYRAQQLADDLENLLDPADVLLFPVEEMLASEMATSSPEFKAQRVLALEALAKQEKKLIVTSMSGLRRFLPPVELWQKSQLKLVVGQDYELADLVQLLGQMGYTRQKQVERPGDFALRGSILDIFPLDMSDPLRADFFDTQLDSLRTFDVADQRSLKNIEQVQILPATDLILIRNVWKKQRQL